MIEPQLTVLPQIEGNGMMHMAGFFPSVPKQVNFELAFAPVGGRWRLFGISVPLGQAPAPAAPDPCAPKPPPPDAKGPAQEATCGATGSHNYRSEHEARCCPIPRSNR